MSGGERPKVETLVFFDLEATGVPSFIPKRQVNITELAMVAIRRKNFTSPLRYLNKLTLCIRPRYVISDGASKLSGLHNEELEEYPSFEDSVQMILQFLDTLPKPICLLAHNGNKFDFPLLIAELRRLSVDLPVECCDTLPALRQAVSSGAHLKSAEEREMAAIANLPDSFWTAFDKCDLFDDKNIFAPRTETTPPKHVTTQPFNAMPCKKPKRDESNTSRNSSRCFRRALFPNKAAEQDTSNQNNGHLQLQGTSTQTVKKVRQSFSLVAIYDLFFGDPLLNVHSADADCLALAKVCHYIKDAFLDYIDSNYVPLQSVPSMW